MNKRWMRASLSALALAGLMVGAGCESSLFEKEGEYLGQGPADTTRGPDKKANNVVIPPDKLPKIPGTDEAVDPGQVTLHRLNRAEYNNTIRDLFGLNLRPADEFPDDDFGHGFNNQADVLVLSPLLFELYEKAANDLIEEVIGSSEEAGDPLDQRFEAENLMGSVGAASGGGWNLWSNGELATTVNIPADGEYNILVRMGAQQAGPDLAKAEVRVNGIVAQTIDVDATNNAMKTYEVTTNIDAGAQTIAVAFINDYYDEPNSADRNLIVDWFAIQGPAGGIQQPGMSEDPNSPRGKIMICTPQEGQEADCARDIFAAFGKRAWRRPLTDADLDPLMALYQEAIAEEEGFEGGVKLGLKGILLSPRFIFRVETDPSPNEVSPHELDDHELATRLSYFLWSSMPDEELMRLADEGKLQDEAVLRAQVERMLDDPRSSALIDNFATQWLYIDSIENVDPDYELFAAFDDELRAAMRQETRLFVQELLQENKPIQELLTAKYSYINGRLAEHYGMDGVSGADFQRISLEGVQRKGLLGHGGLLTTLSFPTRTSPVKRGVWVLEQLMCSAPPPPPPGVEGLMEDGEMMEGGTIRERFEAHRQKPECIGCHQVMDPIGFGMEDYDAIGRYRTTDNGQALDSSGELPGERTFDGAEELADILADDKNFKHCVVEKTTTWALGRGPAYDDDDIADHIVEKLAETGWGFRDMITEIVLSPNFRHRRGLSLAEEQKRMEDN